MPTTISSYLRILLEFLYSFNPETPEGKVLFCAYKTPLKALCDNLHAIALYHEIPTTSEDTKINALLDTQIKQAKKNIRNVKEQIETTKKILKPLDESTLADILQRFTQENQQISTQDTKKINQSEKQPTTPLNKETEEILISLKQQAIEISEKINVPKITTETQQLHKEINERHKQTEQSVLKEEPFAQQKTFSSELPNTSSLDITEGRAG